jgi:hypothetical protein
MNKPKFTLALEYFKKYKEATNEKDKQFYHSQYMNELFRVDQLYAEEDKQTKKNVRIN